MSNGQPDLSTDRQNGVRTGRLGTGSNPRRAKLLGVGRIAKRRLLVGVRSAAPQRLSSGRARQPDSRSPAAFLETCNPRKRSPLPLATSLVDSLSIQCRSMCIHCCTDRVSKNQPAGHTSPPGQGDIVAFRRFADMASELRSGRPCRSHPRLACSDRPANASLQHGVLIAVAAAAAGCGCASLHHGGGAQRTTIASDPPGARLFVNGRPAGITPVDVALRRRDRDVVLRFEKDGYDTTEMPLDRSLSAWLWGNVHG